MQITLQQLSPGQSAVVTALCAQGALRRRLLDFGLTEGTRVRCLRVASARGPMLFRVRGTLLALRRADAALLRAEAEE